MVQIYNYTTSKIVSKYALGIEEQLRYVKHYVSNCFWIGYVIIYAASVCQLWALFCLRCFHELSTVNRAEVMRKNDSHAILPRIFLLASAHMWMDRREFLLYWFNSAPAHCMWVRWGCARQRNDGSCTNCHTLCVFWSCRSEHLARGPLAQFFMQHVYIARDVLGEVNKVNWAEVIMKKDIHAMMPCIFLFVSAHIQNGQSTVGGPKWTKMDLFRQNGPFGLANAKVQFGIRFREK